MQKSYQWQNPTLPHIRLQRVVLEEPGPSGVDGLSVDSQPLANLPQPFFKDRRNGAVHSRPHIQQQVASAAEMMHKVIFE